MSEEELFSGKSDLSGDANLSRLEQALGYTFADRHLLRLALTHESFSNEHENRAQNNERLEFLGDSVLGCVVCTYLYTHLPHQPEGILAKIKSYVASTQSLAEHARTLELGSYLLLGHGADSCQSRNGDNVLADAMEAVIGAMYLDGGFAPAQRFVLSFLSSDMDAMEGASRDHKSRLQEYTQSLVHILPQYEVLSESGPPHAKSFSLCVKIGDQILGYGYGNRKKAAGQEAAAQACRYLDGILGFDLDCCTRIIADGDSLDSDNDALNSVHTTAEAGDKALKECEEALKETLGGDGLADEKAVGETV